MTDGSADSGELVPICHCGHSIYSHGEGPMECEGCANDGEAGYCRSYATAYIEERTSEQWPM